MVENDTWKILFVDNIARWL